MDAVNSSHSYATGGTSVSEFWYAHKIHSCRLVVVRTIEPIKKLTGDINRIIYLYVTGTIQTI